MKRSKPLRRTGFKRATLASIFPRPLSAYAPPAPPPQPLSTVEQWELDRKVERMCAEGGPWHPRSALEQVAAQLRSNVVPLHRGTYRVMAIPPRPVPKRPPIRSRKLLDNVGLLRTCAFCMRQRPVVACHSNWQIHGKAGAMKADDNRIAAGCAECHLELDQGDDWGITEKQRRWWAAHVLTVRTMLLEFLWVEGVPIPDTRSYPF